MPVPPLTYPVIFIRRPHHQVWLTHRNPVKTLRAGVGLGCVLARNCSDKVLLAISLFQLLRPGNPAQWSLGGSVVLAVGHSANPSI